MPLCVMCATCIRHIHQVGPMFSRYGRKTKMVPSSAVLHPCIQQGPLIIACVIVYPTHTHDPLDDEWHVAHLIIAPFWSCML